MAAEKEPNRAGTPQSAWGHRGREQGIVEVVRIDFGLLMLRTVRSTSYEVCTVRMEFFVVNIVWRTVHSLWGEKPKQDAQKNAPGVWSPEGAVCFAKRFLKKRPQVTARTEMLSTSTEYGVHILKETCRTCVLVHTTTAPKVQFSFSPFLWRSHLTGSRYVKRRYETPDPVV